MQTSSHSRFQLVRWSIYIILILAYMSVFFHRMAPAVMSADLMDTFKTSAAALGSLAAMYYYIYTAMQIPAGVLADTLGNRISITIGNLVAGIGTLIFATAEQFATASLGRFMVGLGVSVIFVGLMKSNTVWFRERIYGFVSGLTILLGNLGSVLAAGPLAALLNWWSWRDVFITLGFFSLLLALLTLLFVRNRPEDAGFKSIREMDGHTAHAPRQQHWSRDLLTVIRNIAVWPGFWINFGMAGGLFAFAGLWGIPLLRDLHGLDRTEASGYTTLTLLCMAIATLFYGWLSDRLGRRKPVLMFASSVYLLAWLGFIFLPWQAGLSGMLLYALIGFTGGGFVVTYASAKELIVPALSGMAISLVNTGLFLGAAIMQPLFGWVLDRYWEGITLNAIPMYNAEAYQAAMTLMLGFAVIALIATTRIRETFCQNITVK